VSPVRQNPQEKCVLIADSLALSTFDLASACLGDEGFEKLAPTAIGIEARGASHHLLGSFGYELKPICEAWQERYRWRLKRLRGDEPTDDAASGRPSSRRRSERCPEGQGAGFEIECEQRGKAGASMGRADARWA